MVTDTNGWQQAIYANTKALGGLEVKVDRLEIKAEQIQETLETIDERLTRVEGEVSELKGEVSELKGKINNLEQKLEAIQGIGIAILLGVIANIFSQPILAALHLS